MAYDNEALCLHSLGNLETAKRRQRQGLAIAERAYQQALDYAGQRVQGQRDGAARPTPEPTTSKVVSDEATASTTDDDRRVLRDERGVIVGTTR